VEVLEVSAVESKEGNGPQQRQLSEHQIVVMEQLVRAALLEANEQPYEDVTVRTVAKRAGMASATAYTYFSGKEHLLAEAMWWHIRQSKYLADLSLDLPERVAESIRSLKLDSLGVEAVRACVTALWGQDPDVQRVRQLVTAELGTRLALALADQAHPAVLGVLAVTTIGALTSASVGLLPLAALPTMIAEAAALMTTDLGRRGG
jgi:AcrR family transcriptional regulator